VSEGRHLAELDAARAELQGVLSPACFQRSPRLSALLSYLCSKALSGEADQLKEYTIGVEVLGRPASFDPTEDAGARVEIHRLRKRLSDFYKDEGGAHPVHIEIPQGQYAPLFVSSEPGKPAETPVPPPDVNPRAGEAAIEERGRSRMFWSVLAAAAGLGILIPVFASLRKPAAPAVANPVPVAVAHPENALRIACGRRKPYVDHWGQHWEQDVYAEGGTLYEESRPVVDRAPDPRLFTSGRTGDFEYKIPVPQGSYELRLLFAETAFGFGNPLGGGEASRWFDVAINGHTVLKDFDVLSDAGGPNTATVRVFKNVSPGPDGLVKISFQGRRDKAIISAIELAPQQQKNRLNPIRIAAKSTFYTSPGGDVWTPDNYVRGGQTSIHGGRPMAGTDDSELFTNERFGHFSYAIPVDTGSYSVSLYMAERYYGPGGEKEGGPGSRIFDVACNGQSLLRNLDLFSEAGRDHSVVRTFRGLSPNGQGKLLLTFSPRHDYASIYAIEVLDESK
jgi:hypothetical protein